jgi:hypothetical protein
MNSTIVSRTRNEYNIEINYEKEETSIIDELEEELETLINDIDE